MTLEELKTHICQQIDQRYMEVPKNEKTPYWLHQNISRNPLHIPEIPQNLAPQEGYEAHVLHSWSEPSPFCVSLILIGTEQSTAAHDHICDCGLVCLQGRIEHQHFEDKGDGPLHQTAVEFLRPGSGSYFRCTEPNIHRLVNPDSTFIACSLHIYSYDCAKYTSSVKNCYDSRIPCCESDS